EINRLRLKATTSLISRNDVIIICSVSCIYGIGSPKEYKNLLVHIDKLSPLDQKKFLHELVNIHYVRNDLVLEPGTFRVRGDVIEIFPAYEELAVRIELFGDVIEKIYTFDALTGEMCQKFDEYWVYPAKHFVTTRKKLNRAMDDIREELSDRLKELRAEDKLLEAQRLEQRTMYDLEMMTELGYCSGIENYSRHLEGRKDGERPSTLIDFFLEDFLFFVDESHVSIPQVRAMYNGDRSRKMSLVEHGFRLPSALDNRPMKFDEFENTLNQVIYVSATPSDYEFQQTNGVIVEQIIRPTGLMDPPIIIRKTKGQIDDLIGEIRKVVSKDERVLITTLTKRMAEDLTDYLNDHDVKVRYLHSDIDTVERVEIIRDLRAGVFDVLVGINLLREGLDMPEVSLVAILDADKEGFLRSTRSLIQTIGRAARHLNGKAILYGDRITNSMRQAIDETDRRREKQQAYNLEHGIEPQALVKSITDIMDVGEEASPKDNLKLVRKESKQVLSAKDIASQIKTLEAKMHAYASDLEFEKAASVRDEIHELQQQLIN
ncbi:MAG TPA: excinuclease ABC subunit B, partial [Pseudoalteromonas shioyasakiensis]|nr:excinuclease ABC subunit B [Pseudoalteromonas shioyasakiensis]